MPMVAATEEAATEEVEAAGEAASPDTKREVAGRRGVRGAPATPTTSRQPKARARLDMRLLGAAPGCDEGSAASDE